MDSTFHDEYVETMLAEDISAMCNVIPSELTCNKVLEIDGSSISKIVVTCKSSVINNADNFSSSFLYMFVTPVCYENVEYNTADTMPVKMIRKFMKSGSCIVEDTTALGANDETFTVEFSVPFGFTRYLTIIAGPDCECASISECTVTGLMRRNIVG